MIRYDLNKLGWFQFEKLTQASLKIDLGLAVEAWGESTDLGRDAYTQGALQFPDKAKLCDGPFVFQAKFVAGANAAGASPHIA